MDVNMEGGFLLNAILVSHLERHSFDGVKNLHFQGDGHPSPSLHKKLHSSTLSYDVEFHRYDGVRNIHF